MHSMSNTDLVDFVAEHPDADPLAIELSLRLQYAMDEMDRLTKKENDGQDPGG